MALALGLLTALGFGVGDFLAGLAARRVPARVVTVGAKAVGAAVLLLAYPLAGGGGLDGPWAPAAGVALGLGSLVYYRALAAGRMGLVAAVTGVVSALVPFGAGLLLGERPALPALAGVALVTAALALATARPAPVSVRRAGRGAGLAAAVAGALFGLFFVLLDRGQGGDAVLSAAAAMATAGLLLLVPVRASRPRPRVTPAALGAIAGVGCGSAVATLAFVLAVREGLLALAGVAAALSPLPTAACARVFLGERLTRRQAAGFALALVGLALMAVPS